MATCATVLLAPESKVSARPARIVVTRAVPQTTIECMRSSLPEAEVIVNPEDANLSAAQFFDLIGTDCDALLCTLADNLDEAAIARLPDNLKVIATYAVGTNNIDIASAAARGIAVANTPDVLTKATAEIAVVLMLTCARRIISGDQLMRAGEFKGWSPLMHLGRDVYDTKVGVVGPGRIGAQVAQTMHRGFGCSVVYTSRSVKPELENTCGAEKVELDELLSQSDFVSLHCPLNEETYHLLDARRIGLMKKTAFLVNTARGPVVDELALVDALERGVIAGAGFDVYEEEPALSPRLAELENVVLLPHIGSATHVTRDKMGLMCANAIVDVLQGRTPGNAVTP